MLSIDWNIITDSIKEAKNSGEEHDGVYRCAKAIAINMRHVHKRFSIIRFMKACGFPNICGNIEYVEALSRIKERKK